MANVEFEDINAGMVPLAQRQFKPKGLVGFFINKGWAKDEGGAYKIMLGIIISSVVLSIIVVLVTSRDNSNERRVSPERIKAIMRLR